MCYVSAPLAGTLSATAELVAAVADREGWAAYLPHRDTARPGDSTEDAVVLDTNLRAVLSSSCLVAVASPSLGVGVELFIARIAEKPTLLLQRRGEHLSRMITGLLPQATTIAFERDDELSSLLPPALDGISKRLAAGRPRGLLVVVEGGDGVGKTRAAGLLRDQLRDLGHDVETLSDPPKVPPWPALRETFQKGGEIDPYAVALLFLAARVDVTRRFIEPALKAGRVVVMDRYSASWLTYQQTQLGGVVRDSADRALWLLLLSTLAGAGGSILRPDLTILLEASAEEMTRRRELRGEEPSKYDVSDIQAAVVRDYRAAAAAVAGEVVVLDTTRLTPEQVAAEMLSAVKASLTGRRDREESAQARE